MVTKLPYLLQCQLSDYKLLCTLCNTEKISSTVQNYKEQSYVVHSYVCMWCIAMYVCMYVVHSYVCMWCIAMYVCMYVCMYVVHSYVCMYVCMYVCGA